MTSKIIKIQADRKLFLLKNSLRGVDHVACTGRRECFTPGEQLAVTEENGATDPATESDPRFLRKLL
ncbi:hypothetical protein NPIL_476431 [Nephila pilipes]|uniref:Uncharacterized protein n=1 Tax=Nephila pilipes TaxID=299642 RepID=A0A8X6U967_NEPPI|nr:hypothetical protein NPIL_476431 [Nephila pilipes]